MGTELTIVESRKLETHEDIIRAAVVDAWHMAGKSLRIIRDERLYRDTHKSFEDYCIKAWGLAKSASYQLIQDEFVRSVVLTVPQKSGGHFVPILTQRQARELSRLSDEREIATVWTRAAGENGQVKTSRIKEEIERLKSEAPEPEPDEEEEAPDVSEFVAANVTKLDKLGVTQEQVQSLADQYTHKSQDDLVQSVLDGRQTMDQAIETGEVPDIPIEQRIKAQNHAIESRCQQIKKLIEEIWANGGPWVTDFETTFDSGERQIVNGIGTFRLCKASKPCPTCEGEGCEDCFDTGFVTRKWLDQR